MTITPPSSQNDTHTLWEDGPRRILWSGAINYFFFLIDFYSAEVGFVEVKDFLVMPTSSRGSNFVHQTYMFSESVK